LVAISNRKLGWEKTGLGSADRATQIGLKRNARLSQAEDINQTGPDRKLETDKPLSIGNIQLIAIPN
jgi:hypothetical protein